MSLQTFKETLDQVNGLRPLNLAIAEENEYYLESLGGEDHLRDHFPLMYKSYVKSREAALYRMKYDLKEDSSDVHFTSYDIMTLSPDMSVQGGDEQFYLAACLGGSFLDQNTSVASTAPAKSFNVLVDGKIYDPDSSRLSFVKIHEYYSQVNKIDEQFISEQCYRKAEFWDRRLRFRFTVSVYDDNNKLSPYVYTCTKNFGNVMTSAIGNIHIDAPVSLHPQTQEIRILYGRSAQNLEYPDYIYATNNANANNGILWTILPIKGEVTLKSILTGTDYYTFKELTKPEAGEHLSRSVLNYADKEWKVYRNDLKDEDLYKLMADNNFSVTVGANKVETLHFYLFNPSWGATQDRRYDWVADIEKASADDIQRICYLIGGFDYTICRMNKNGEAVETESDEIQFYSTDNPPEGRKYYEYFMGSNTIYIPPIHLWWGCYGKDVSITLANGERKPACQVEIGDKLPCRGNKLLTVNNVYTGREDNLYTIRTEGGARISVSKGHPMLLADGTGRAAERLSPGDELLMADQTTAKIASIETAPYDGTVYNFSFDQEEDGNYLVADGFYSGDFYAQNKLTEEAAPLTAEQEQLCSELKAMADFLKSGAARV